MDQVSLYQDIADRCSGDIYLGVVGPVRTGKSTFIKRFMEQIVLPHVENEEARRRMVDELPQSGAGRTIMTVQPRFVPEKAAEVSLKDEATARVRLVDSVGYVVDGALGLDEEGKERMVRTPWYEHDIPFGQAAQVGTRKVIRDHSTIGVVVTTDGSVTDIPRESYVDAEKRAVKELKSLGKPFSVVLNSAHPKEAATQNLKRELEKTYAVPVVALDVLNLSGEDVHSLLESILFEFPLREVRINAPTWLTSLEPEHWLAEEVFSAVREAAEAMEKVRDHGALKAALSDLPDADGASVEKIDLAAGSVEYRLGLRDGLFYRILGEACGETIEGEEHLFRLMRELIGAKRKFDAVSDALESVQATGYGVVEPTIAETTLKQPEVVRQGSRYGVRLVATAPSIHMIRVDMQTEINPVMGSEKQSEELMEYLMRGYEGGEKGVWQTEIFGKSLEQLVREGLSGKIGHMSTPAREKLQEALSKIMNEGSGGMICVLL